MKAIFLNDQLENLYDEFMQGTVPFSDLGFKHSELVVAKLKSRPDMTNLKRVVNSINLSVDNITKKYGRSMFRKISYEDLYKNVFK